MAFVGKWFGFGRDEHYDTGVRAFDVGQYDEAITGFDLCLTTSHDPATLRLARFYKAESLLGLGRSAIAAGNYSGAVEFLERAAGIQPNFADIQFALSRAYLGNSDLSRARLAVEKALQINPGFPAALLAEAQFLITDANWDAARVRIQSAADRDPQISTEAVAALLAAGDGGDFRETVIQLAHLLGSLTTPPKGLIEDADAFAKNRQWPEAVDAYQRAVSANPRYADVRCRYGQALLEVDSVAEAESQFRTALEINPNYADAHAYLGITLRRLGNNLAAKAAFGEALRVNPSHVIAGAEITRIRV